MTRRRGVRDLWAAFLLFAIVSAGFLGLVRVCLLSLRLDTLDAWHAIPALLLAGLRFDLALVGVLLCPAILSSLPALSGGRGRALARPLVTLWLGVAFASTVVVEAISAIDLVNDGQRPDAATFAEPGALGARLAATIASNPVPATLVAAIAALAIVGFSRRLLTIGPLRQRLSPVTGIAGLATTGGLAGVAIVSGLDPSRGPIGMSHSLVGADRSLNELAVNGLYRLLLSLA